MTAVQAIAPARERAAVPLLVGALVGSLCAGRLESAILCLAVAVVAAACVPARWPSRAWLVALVPSTIVAWVLNLYLTPGDALWPRSKACARRGTRRRPSIARPAGSPRSNAYGCPSVRSA